MGLAFTWYFLILSYLASLLALAFVFMLFGQFLKKKHLEQYCLRLVPSSLLLEKLPLP